MRDLLTGLAIILIVALTTALVAPYLVDWNSQRAFLEARLSHALGQKVTIGGNIDLKLLPTPYLVLDQTVVGGDDAPVRMGIHHLDLELSVTPLLHGEFEVTEARLLEPTLRVALQPDRSLPSVPAAPAYAANLRFDKIEVDDGTIAIADPISGRTLVVDHLDMTADAPSPRGPFKGSGTAGDPATRTKFRFATTAAQKGQAHAHLVVEETANHAGVDLDGLATVADADGGSTPSFDGTLALAGHVEDAQDNLLAWRLAGPLKADPQHATLAGGELRLGSEDAGLSLAASGSADFGETPKLALSLSAKQLDIDRLSGAPTDASKPVPPKLPDAETLRRWFAASSLPLDLDVAVDSATYGGETLSDIAAHLGLGGGSAARTVKLAGDGPGGLHLALDGRLVPERANGFDGSVSASADNLATAVTWLATVDPDLAVKPTDFPFDTMKADGHVASSPDGIALTQATVTLDRSTLSGSAHVTPGTSTAPPKVAADVTAEALDLDALPDLATLRGPTSAFDLDLKLDAKAIKVSRFGDSGLDAGRLRLALSKTGRRFVVAELRADNLGGATIAGSGSLDPDKAQLSATVDAAKLTDAADLLRRLAPGRISDALIQRAAALAPATLKIDAAFAANDAGGLEASSLDLKGRLAATKVTAHLAPDPQHGRALAASAEAPEGGTLLAQLGFQTLPLNLIGPSQIALTAKGQAGQPLATEIDGTFGATRIAVDGQFDWLGAAQGGSGTLDVHGDDVGPILQSLALAFPDMTGHIPIAMTGAIAVAANGVALTDLQGTVAEDGVSGGLKWQTAAADQPVLTGALDFDRLTLAGLLGLSLGPAQPPSADGAVSSAPFAAGLVDPPASALQLKAKSLELVGDRVARNASFDLGVAPNLVTLRKLDADLDDGHVVANVTLRRDGSQAALEGDVGLKGVGLDLASVKGTLDGHLDIAGSGTNPQALVASLAGSGDATLADTHIPGADPKALPTVFDAVENDQLAVDAESVVRAYNSANADLLDAGTRRFHLGLAGGTLHFDAADPPVDAGAVQGAIAADLDLRRARLDVTTTETLRDVPKNWVGPLPSIAIVWSGPIAEPRRKVDVGNFLDAVAARALARETARIEAYEFDIRERAFFNARLQSETLRDDDRRKAEDDARKAEAARIAAKKAAEQKAADSKAAAAAQKAAEDRAQQESLPDQGSPSFHDPQGDPHRFEAPPPGRTADPSAAGRY